MIPRYVILNVKERDEFEKNFQLPYGYKGCFISYDLNDAIDQIERDKYMYCGCCIERIDEDGKEIVYINE